MTGFWICIELHEAVDSVGYVQMSEEWKEKEPYIHG
jgi:hypothetical protein